MDFPRLSGPSMSKEKDDRIDFKFVQDAIKNQDKEKLAIVADDFVRWTKQNKREMYDLMQQKTGRTEEEVDEFIREQVLREGSMTEEALERVEKKYKIFKNFQKENQ